MIRHSCITIPLSIGRDINIVPRYDYFGRFVCGLISDGEFVRNDIGTREHLPSAFAILRGGQESVLEIGRILVLKHCWNWSLRKEMIGFLS